MHPDEPLDLYQVTPSVDPLTHPPGSNRNKVFVGRFGLRAGWSALIYIPLAIVIAGILFFTSLAAVGRLKQVVANMSAQSHASRDTTPQPIPDVRSLDAFTSEFPQFGGFVLAALVLARIERRRFSVYGIGVPRLFDFIPGAFWGLVTLSLLVAILRATHHLVFDSQVLHGPTIFLSGSKWLLAFLAVGLLEEYSSRGFLQFTLTRGVYGLAEKLSPRHPRVIAFSIAAFFMSLLFSAGHLSNARENPMGIVMVFLAAILFSYALWRTGSLWWAIGNHMAWDWAESFLYGVPDSGQISAGRLFHTHPVGNTLLSGGIDGPEGSAFAIPILILAVVVVRFTTRPGIQPPLQQEPRLSELPNRPPIGLVGEHDSV